jgi:hypothetical protein
MHVVFEPHEGLETALLYVEKPAERSGRRSARATDGGADDVAELVSQTTIEELNQAAEEYFRFNHQLGSSS